MKRFITGLAAITFSYPIFASDKDLIPPQLPKAQQENLLRFFEQHQKPDRFIPADAKVIGTLPGGTELTPSTPAAKPIKQYTVQVLSHRPVPGQPDPTQVDVYYYRPNPEKGKAGVTVRYTVDLTSGTPVGPAEVLLNHHTAMAREEVTEAVALAREKSDAVKALYKNRDSADVRYEYLQMKVNAKNEQHEPGDRVARIVFTAAPAEGESPPKPVKVIVNLTKEVVVNDVR